MSRELMVPVSGIRPTQVPDTYTSPRTGGREHRALDILAPRGTPVLAADYGRVLRMRTNPAGGITIYEVDAGNRFVYYYAHLDHYASTLSEGKDVAKGEIIGYVGTRAMRRPTCRICISSSCGGRTPRAGGMASPSTPSRS